VSVLCCVALSNGQFPNTGSGDQASPVPLFVSGRPESPRPSPGMRREQMIADLKDLIREAEALQQEVQASRGQTVSAQSFKRSQKIEAVARRTRKNWKD
jgi:hypothetical protein